jgi:hypothetical protein
MAHDRGVKIAPNKLVARAGSAQFGCAASPQAALFGAAQAEPLAAAQN